MINATTYLPATGTQQPVKRDVRPEGSSLILARFGRHGRGA